MRILALLAAASFSFGLSPVPASAGSGHVAAKLKLRFAGLPVGRFKYGVTLRDAAYTLSGRTETTGVAKVFAKTEATFSSQGKVSGAAPTPRKHKMRYTSDGKRGSLDMGFQGGALARNKVSPKVKPRKDRVAVKPSHLASVLDPISAVLLPAPVNATLAQVCSRTLPVYDGQNRFDIVLAPKRTVNGSAKGYRGPVHVCAARYRPVSGHRASRDSVKRMAAERRIEIGFAPVGDSGTWSLFQFRFPTKYGPASGEAYSFKAS